MPQSVWLYGPDLALALPALGPSQWDAGLRERPRPHSGDLMSVTVASSENSDARGPRRCDSPPWRVCQIRERAHIKDRTISRGARMKGLRAPFPKKGLAGPSRPAGPCRSGEDLGKEAEHRLPAPLGRRRIVSKPLLWLQPEKGFAYNATAAKRSWQAMLGFFAEIFA